MSDHHTPIENHASLEAVAATTVRQENALHHQEVDPEAFVREVVKAKRDVEIARMQFDLVSDPLVIDHIVFRLGAAEKRLNYLFQLARKLGIALDGMSLEWLSADV